MAGYQDWMNPNPQAANMDRLLNARAGVMGERNQTRERVEPQWQLPWQGPEGFVTDIPGRQQFNPSVRPLEVPLSPPGTTDEFINNDWVPGNGGREGLQYDFGIDGNTESFGFDNQLTPQGIETFRRNQGLTGSGRVKDIRTKQWPPSGSSIADSFYRGVTGLSNLVGRGMDQLIPPAY